MRSDEQKIFATTKEDLRQVTADVPVVMRRQVPVIQRAQRTVDISTGPVHWHARVVIFSGCAQMARRR